jgi:RNA polymerase sigma-70 factor (ECF subfamily)
MRDDRSAQLYRRYAPVIYAKCRRILGDPRAAEDATQETFVRVHRHLARAPEDALRWIYRIATNYCLNELRDRAHRPLPIDDVAAHGGTDVALIDGAPARDLVVRVLGGLRAQTAHVAWLHHVDGLDQEEVGQVLGVSRRTVGNRLAEFRQAAQSYVRSIAI